MRVKYEYGVPEIPVDLAPERTVRKPNRNDLLGESEKSLGEPGGVEFHHRNKTMNTYHRPTDAGSWKGLVWVPKVGSRRVFLANLDYPAVDTLGREHQGGWGGYPYFVAEPPTYIDYLLRLVKHTTGHPLQMVAFQKGPL